MKLRLFAGITAPPEWKRALTEWRRTVQPRFTNSFARWTSEQNLHLTLRFFGSVEEPDAVAIGQALQKVVANNPAFSVSAGELGCFPNASRPRIVWLGLQKDINPLIKFEANLRSATANFGQPPEDRDFHPHLTLARVKEPRRHDRAALSELIRKGSPIEVPDWPITEVELIRSEPNPTGSIYTTLATFPLQRS